MDTVSIIISILVLMVSIITTLKIYERSQRSNAKNLFIYPLFESERENNKIINASICIDNHLSNYPIFDIKVYYLGTSIDKLRSPKLFGVCQQVIPNEKVVIKDRKNLIITDNYKKKLVDSLAGEHVNYNIVCVYNTSKRKRWLKTYDGEFYRYNLFLSKFRKLVNDIEGNNK